MNYFVLRRYSSKSILDFIITDEAINRYKSHLFYRDKSYKEFDWKQGWSGTYRGIINNPKLWACTPTTTSTPEEVVSNHPELFI